MLDLETLFEIMSRFLFLFYHIKLRSLKVVSSYEQLFNIQIYELLFKASFSGNATLGLVTRFLIHLRFLFPFLHSRLGWLKGEQN